MITIYNTKKAEKRDNALYILSELRGLSTDEKPTKIDENNIDNGSVFIEIDTGKISLYDLDNQTWGEI